MGTGRTVEICLTPLKKFCTYEGGNSSEKTWQHLHYMRQRNCREDRGTGKPAVQLRTDQLLLRRHPGNLPDHQRQPRPGHSQRLYCIRINPQPAPPKKIGRLKCRPFSFQGHSITMNTPVAKPFPSNPTGQIVPASPSGISSHVHILPEEIREENRAVIFSHVLAIKFLAQHDV